MSEEMKTERNQYTTLKAIIPPISESGFMNYKACRVISDYPFTEEECKSLPGTKVEEIINGAFEGDLKYMVIDKNARHDPFYKVGTINKGEQIIAWDNFSNGTVVVWINTDTMKIERAEYLKDHEIDFFYGIDFDYNPDDTRLGYDIREIFSKCSSGVRDFIRCGGGYYAFIDEVNEYFNIIPMICIAKSCEANRNNNDYKCDITGSANAYSDIRFTPVVSKMSGNHITMIQYCADGIHERVVEDVEDFDHLYVDDTNLFMKRAWSTMFMYNSRYDFIDVLGRGANGSWKGSYSAHDTINAYLPGNTDDELAVILHTKTNVIYEDTFVLDFGKNLYKVVNHEDLVIDEDHP